MEKLGDDAVNTGERKMREGEAGLGLDDFWDLE